MTTIAEAIADHTAALKQVADEAGELLDYFYAGLGLTRPTNNNKEE